MSSSGPSPTLPQPPAGAPPRAPRGGDPPPSARGPSPLARRVGPIVAAVGVLAAVAVLAWVAFAPDNVEGTVAEAGLDVPATAALPVDSDGCIGLVDGDGSSREVCVDVGTVGRIAGTPWWVDGQLVVDGRDGPVTVDLSTGETTAFDGEGQDGPLGPRDEHGFREDVWVDGGVVRHGPWGDEDGEVLLDLGGPVRTIRNAVLSPDGAWVVATDEQDRVLVAATAAPDEVHVWFELEEDRWFDLWAQVRFDG